MTANTQPDTITKEAPAGAIICRTQPTTGPEGRGGGNR